MAKILNWTGKIYADKFRRYLLIALVIIGMFLIFRGAEPVRQESGDGIAVDFFFHPSCPHCKEQMRFNEKLMDKFPEAKTK